MDFMDRRSQQTQQANSENVTANQAAGSAKKSGRFHKIKNHKLLNFAYVSLLFSITILLIGVVLSIYLFDENSEQEDSYVDTSKYQAVFLNGGQVYFGKIVDLNGKYMSLSNIYYLTPNQPVQSDGQNNNQSNNFTIRKLGCELHRPQDVMVINHDQIIFWENLKDEDNQNTVPGAIKKLAEQPQNCDEQQTQSNTNNNSPEPNNTNNNSSNDTNTNTPAPAN